VLAVLLARQQLVDELRALVGLLAVEEAGGLLGGGDLAGDVEVDAAEELLIAAQRRGVGLLGGELGVDELVDVAGELVGREFLPFGEGGADRFDRLGGVGGFLRLLVRRRREVCPGGRRGRGPGLRRPAGGLA